MPLRLPLSHVIIVMTGSFSLMPVEFLKSAIRLTLSQLEALLLSTTHSPEM